MDKNELREPTAEESILANEACELIFEMGVDSHVSDKHVVEKMIKYGYRMTNPDYI